MEDTVKHQQHLATAERLLERADTLAVQASTHMNAPAVHALAILAQAHLDAAFEYRDRTGD